MLNSAFLETPDYRTLIETTERPIVVGRRGTGKSALTYKLQQHWARDPQTRLITLLPSEYQMIALRPRVRKMGPNFGVMRATSRILWRYSLMIEIADTMSATSRFRNIDDSDSIKRHHRERRRHSGDSFDFTCSKLDELLDVEREPEEIVGELPRLLETDSIEKTIHELLDQNYLKPVLLIDRLDEGFQPDDVSVALIDGLAAAIVDFRQKLQKIRSVLFLRDNIFRAIQSKDPDYVRSIEGNVLRLHWDDRALFTLVCSRLREGLKLEPGSPERIWNQVVADDLKGRQGFLHCLRHTLYRPRDAISLLNDALYNAGSVGQDRIVVSNVESAARTMSEVRLQDLKNEYTAILPGLERYIGAFHEVEPEMTVAEASEKVQRVLDHPIDDKLIEQDFLILENPKSVLQALYSVGFLGIKEPNIGSVVFCHDGRSPDRVFEDNDRLLIHPCYWMAISSTHETLRPEQINEIYDEYDIEISSETPEIRSRRIRELIAELDEIDEGAGGASEFEAWCCSAIRICFAGSLHNVELRPNKNAKARRDIVATNLSDGGVWRRVLEDYRSRQVVFEIKNYQELEASDYHQVLYYLDNDYGDIGFVVSRRKDTNLRKGKDLDWVRTIYSDKKKVVVLLSADFFSKHLNKLRDPQKHDDANNALNRILDQYVRRYFNGQV